MADLSDRELRALRNIAEPKQGHPGDEEAIHSLVLKNLIYYETDRLRLTEQGLVRLDQLGFKIYSPRSPDDGE